MRHDWLRFDAVLFEALTKNESVKAGLAGEIAVAVREGGRRRDQFNAALCQKSF
jgi:hypothetical protein